MKFVLNNIRRAKRLWNDLKIAYKLQDSNGIVDYFAKKRIWKDVRKYVMVLTLTSLVLNGMRLHKLTMSYVILLLAPFGNFYKPLVGIASMLVHNFLHMSLLA